MELSSFEKERGGKHQSSRQRHPNSLFHSPFALSLSLSLSLTQDASVHQRREKENKWYTCRRSNHQVNCTHPLVDVWMIFYFPIPFLNPSRHLEHPFSPSNSLAVNESSIHTLTYTHTLYTLEQLSRFTLLSFHSLHS